MPPPGRNQVLYHGVLGARAAWRTQVVPGRRDLSPTEVEERALVVLTRTPSTSGRPQWTPWEVLLRQAFDVAPRACPVCGERMQLRSVVMGYASVRVLRGLTKARRAPPASERSAS